MNRPITILLIAAVLWGEPSRPAAAETLYLNLAPQTRIAPKGADTAKLRFGLRRLYDDFQLFRSYFGVNSEWRFQPHNRFLEVINGYVAIEAVAADDPQALETDLKRLNIQSLSKFRSHISGRLPVRELIRMARLKNPEICPAGLLHHQQRSYGQSG